MTIEFGWRKGRKKLDLTWARVRLDLLWQFSSCKMSVTVQKIILMTSSITVSG